ncbi:MAG TPA: EF-hand domain-containing protein [Pirellulales bacterium]
MAVVIALVGSLLLASNAEARGGPSPAQKKAMQQYIQQQQQMQQNMAKAQQKRDKDLMDRFDLNKNGKIDVSEKTAYNKYWRDVRLGKIPHPYANITPAEINASPTTGKKATPAKATKKN